MVFLRRIILNSIFLYHSLAIGISMVLFLVPFFWLKQGFVDLGGDGGRLYFLDPFLILLNNLKEQNPSGIVLYAIIPHSLFLFLVKSVLNNSTNLIAIDRGIQLSMAFYTTYLVIKEILSASENKIKSIHIPWVSIVGGLVYVGFISAINWPGTLLTQNQIFLNPLIFYLFLHYCLTNNVFYMIGLFIFSIVYSANFGYMSAPQLFSFFPISLLFAIIFVSFIIHRKINWKGVLFVGLLFFGLHAFHLLPLLASFFEKGGMIQNFVFSEDVIGNRGVYYFDFNHLNLGKISIQLFQPPQWNGQNILVLIVPLVTFLGFLKKPSKLLLLLGIFFAITLFLVSANITLVGVQFYRMLFSIPGFSMFRSFNEKWYFVYAFFYTLLFSVSFYQLFAKKRAVIAILVGLCVIGSILFRIYPFLQGKTVNTIHWQSKNVSVAFTIDPDLMDAVGYVKTLPENGNVLTLPLTSPAYQIAYGKEGGAYVGISMIQFLGGRKDFSGFWSFGPYQESVFHSLREENTHDFMQSFSLLNIRYIFHNSDARIMDNFPGFPYVIPGGIISLKDQIPMIQDQEGYGRFLSFLPLERIYEKGFYRIYEIDSASIRPTVYVPDVLYASISGALLGSSFRSAFGDEKTCETLKTFDMLCDGYSTQGILPDVSFTKASTTKYDVTIDLKQRKEPFLVILSEDYHSSWEMKVDGKKEGMTHIVINGYANAWIIEPEKVENNGVIQGSIQLGFQRYYTYGWIISGATAVLLVIGVLYRGVRKLYEKK